jgi:hypothetical protein
MPKEQVPPQIALSRFLDAVRDEAAVNVSFRNRLISALALEVIIEGEEEISTLDPVSLCVAKSESAFRRIYEQLPPAKLKAVLLEAELAKKPDLTGQTKPGLINMLYQRARNRAEERGRIDG